MTTTTRRQYKIMVIDRTVAILQALHRQPRSLTELAHAAELDESTTLRYLSCLGSYGWVEREEWTGQYRLGIGLFHLGQAALDGRDIVSAARPVMVRLRDRLQETVNLALRSGDNLVLIVAVESQRSIKKGASVGDQDIWHASGLGKAMLAFMTAEDLGRILVHNQLTPLTPCTITDERSLGEELAHIRKRGYAIDDGESEEGLRCVAAPILDQHGIPLYSLSVSAPANRLPIESIPELGLLVQGAAREIATSIGILAGGDGLRTT